MNRQHEGSALHQRLERMARSTESMADRQQEMVSKQQEIGENIRNRPFIIRPSLDPVILRYFLHALRVTYQEDLDAGPEFKKYMASKDYQHVLNMIVNKDKILAQDIDVVFKGAQKLRGMDEEELTKYREAVLDCTGKYCKWCEQQQHTQSAQQTS